MYISLDLETTGFDHEKDHIIEFGAVKFDLEGNQKTLGFLMNPGIQIPEMVSHLTGITNVDVMQAPFFEDKKQEIIDFIGDDIIIGHNISFDTGFLKSKQIKLSNIEYDTLELASILLRDVSSYSLETLTHHLKLTHEEKHRALDDAIAAMELFLHLVNELEKIPVPLMEKIRKISQKSNWPLKKLLGEVEYKDSRPQKTKIKNRSDKTSSGEKINFTPESGIFESDTAKTSDIISEFLKTASPKDLISVPKYLFQKITPESKKFVMLDVSEEYISLKRFEEYANKDFYENHEIIALIKYLIWIEKTETGHLQEINLVGEEYRTKEMVNINPELTGSHDEPFILKQQNVNLPKICTHNYLIRTNNLRSEKLLIIDFDFFIFEIFRENCFTVGLKNIIYPLKILQNTASNQTNKQTVESLIARSTIFFGLLGMILGKYCPEQDYMKIIIDETIAKSKDWLEIKQSVQNLFTISREFQNLSDPEKSVLNSWKNRLKILQKIFLDNDNNFEIQIFKNLDEDIFIKKIPISLCEMDICEKLNLAEKFYLHSFCADLNDKAGFFKKIYRLYPDIPFQNREKKTSKIRIFTPPQTYAHDENQLTGEILQEILEDATSSAIVVTSKKRVNFYTIILNRHFKSHKIRNKEIFSMAMGSLGKIEEKIKNKKSEAVIILTNENWLNFKYPEKIDKLIIDKIPFQVPDDSFLKWLKPNDLSNEFAEFQLPLAIMKMKKIINRLAENLSLNKTGKVFILDPRINKNYGDEIKKQLI